MAVSGFLDAVAASRQAAAAATAESCQVQVLDLGPALFVDPILIVPNVINLVGLKKSCS
jgi:hypothetical protein